MVAFGAIKSVLEPPNCVYKEYQTLSTNYQPIPEAEAVRVM